MSFLHLILLFAGIVFVFAGAILSGSTRWAFFLLNLVLGSEPTLEKKEKPSKQKAWKKWGGYLLY